MALDTGLLLQQPHKQVALREAITVNNNTTEETKRRKKSLAANILGVDNLQQTKLQGLNRTTTTVADTTVKK